uniref:F-box and leucine-rich repeat protein 17 n=1 Tax=Hippocampus comes TaxID=109280 RepID=A0A3Q3DG13_HIPCM
MQPSELKQIGRCTKYGAEICHTFELCSHICRRLIPQCNMSHMEGLHLQTQPYKSCLSEGNISVLDSQVQVLQMSLSLLCCRCVEIIAKEGRSLKELYLVSCKITDHALIAIGQYSSTIETVDAGWCKDITDQGAMQIAESSKSLRYLGLMRCDKVNEETVERLVVQYPHIVFSTVMQDCKRTLERAYQMGWSPSASNAL